MVGLDTPVDLFLWRVFIRSENRERVVDMYIADRITCPPFSVYLATKTSLALVLVLALVLIVISFS